ncbi:MAG: TRZ/ATZ family hydrolase [Porticoccus sp.]|nr:TRZ/ATZ family hydrolase [Porticoccus sp.]MBQ0806770.1 TRZ/ATZ family hydrolase [Porticoccus sp.]
MAAISVDLIISAQWTIPVIPKGAVFEDCSVVIDQGNIVAILPTTEATRKYIALEHTELPNHVLIPGLINAHGHAAMTLLRGYADDQPLQNWLEKHIWPAEQQWVGEDFVRDGTELAIAEMIRSGTSCFSDMYFFPDYAAEAASHSGIRSQIAFPVFDFPSAWGRGPEDYIHKGLQLRDDYKDRDLTRIAFGPHAPYTLSNGPLETIATYAEELDSHVQIHLHETAIEVANSIKEHGVRPIQRLVELGLLSPRTQCVHMTQLDEQDISTLVEHNAHVVHCPESNLKLASGFCPVTTLLDSGINVALGTDGAASNNNLDMFGEMSTAALVAKAVSGNAGAVDAHTALQMATINGAKAMGWEDQIGSIEAGKSADLAAITLGTIESEPLYNPASQLLYTNAGSRVSHLWVNGAALMIERQLQTLNEQEVLTKAKQWQRKIAHNR